MNHEEVAALRIYHETRCEQEQRRIRNATCAKAALAHAHLFSLHRLMTIDLSSPSEMATSGAPDEDIWQLTMVALPAGVTSNRAERP